MHTPCARICRAGVSIHAPREGCDVRNGLWTWSRSVSIHAPREGCDLMRPISVVRLIVFQFTHPGRGAT